MRQISAVQSSQRSDAEEGGSNSGSAAEERRRRMGGGEREKGKDRDNGAMGRGEVEVKVEIGWRDSLQYYSGKAQKGKGSPPEPGNTRERARARTTTDRTNRRRRKTRRFGETSTQKKIRPPPVRFPGRYRGWTDSNSLFNLATISRCQMSVRSARSLSCITCARRRLARTIGEKTMHGLSRCLALEHNRRDFNVHINSPNSNHTRKYTYADS